MTKIMIEIICMIKMIIEMMMIEMMIIEMMMIDMLIIEMMMMIEMLIIEKIRGFSIIGGYWPRRHFHAVCFSGFSAMLDLYMGGCQAALGEPPNY